MPSSSGPLPVELTQTRQWLRDVFQEASRGLPWPQQAGLLLIEQALVAGLFGGLMVSAWMLEETRRRSDGPPLPARFDEVVRALEAVALGPLPAQLHAAIKQLGGLPGGPEVLDRAVRDLGNLWPKR